MTKNHSGPKDDIMQLRLSSGLRNRINERAKALGISSSEFVRQAAINLLIELDHTQASKTA